jgi:hypothetical protein
VARLRVRDDETIEGIARPPERSREPGDIAQIAGRLLHAVILGQDGEHIRDGLSPAASQTATCVSRWTFTDLCPRSTATRCG